jgi:hypothetical protein
MVRRELVGAVLLLVWSQLMTSTAIAEPSSDVALAPAAQQTFARVIGRYGAGLRETSEADGLILHRAVCNEMFLVVGDNGPWRQLFMVVGLPDEQTEDEDDDIFGWMRDEHIAVGPAPGAVDCSTAAGFAVGAYVESWTDLGCVPLRAFTDGSAPQSECRPDGVRYQVTNGPVFAAGEDWYELRPPGGATGWVPGALLLPTP